MIRIALLIALLPVAFQLEAQRNRYFHLMDSIGHSGGWFFAGKQPNIDIVKYDSLLAIDAKKNP